MIIKADRVRGILKEQLKGKFQSLFLVSWLANLFKPTIFLADRQYWAPPIEDYRDVMIGTGLKERAFVAGKGDCDDFALLLKAAFVNAGWKDGKRRSPYCFGEIWGRFPSPHALNWFIDDTERLYLVEPQDNRMFLPRETDTGIYLIKA